MKAPLILACALFGVAFAGVRELTPGEEADAIRIFERLCSGGGYSGGGGYGRGGEGGVNIGGEIVYCKRAPGDIRETLTHQVNVNTGGSGPEQIVYVEPPPVHYKHKVLVQGSGSQGGQTSVFVLPQKATHELSANFQGGPTSVQKPTVYFLKGGTSSSSVSGGYGSPVLGYGAPAPKYSYGAPPPAPPPKYSYGSPSPAPQPTYGAPPPAPQPTYGAPLPAPQPTYRAPPPAPVPTYGAPAPAPQPGYQKRDIVSASQTKNEPAAIALAKAFLTSLKHNLSKNL